MTFLQGKTPISFLQELCTKRGITPQYDLIANEGAVHEPTFVFKVTSGEFIGTGKGMHQSWLGLCGVLYLFNLFIYIFDLIYENFLKPEQNGLGLADSNVLLLL